MNYIPYVLEKGNNKERVFDIYSRLLQERIIILNGEINDHLSSLIVSQLLYLDSIDNNEISLYINSPGGSINAGLAIYDTMNYIKSNVNTICIGMAASMAAFLLAAGKKRYSLPNSEIMIHQPLGGFNGQTTDVVIHSNRLIQVKNKLNKLLAQMTNKSIEQVTKDTERDNFMTPIEALNYNLIDEIITKLK